MIFPWDKIWEAIDKKIDEKVNAKFKDYTAYLDDRHSIESDRVAKSVQEAIKEQMFQGFQESLEDRKMAKARIIPADVPPVDARSLAEVTLDSYRHVKEWWEAILRNSKDPLFGSDISFQDLYADYAHWSRDGVMAPIGQTPFSKFFWKICPGLTSIKQDGATVYSIPQVEYCRLDFVNFVREDRKYDGLLYRVGAKAPPKDPTVHHQRHRQTPVGQRLDEALARNVKTLLEVTQDHKTIAKLTGVRESTVYNIKKGQSFRKLNPWPLGPEREACYDLLGRKELAGV